MPLSDLTKFMPGFGGGGASMTDMIVAILIGVIAISLCGGFLYYIFKIRKHWNLLVEFRLPRDISETTDDDGNKTINGTIIKEWGKGFYDSRRGVVFIKRPKKRAVPMKPFNIKEFLSGKSNILTVIQVGINDYRPVLESSYLELEDTEPTRDDDGEIMLDEEGNPVYSKAALINAKIDTSESKAWRNTFEREAKSAYTMMGFLREYGQYFAFGFMIICVFVGFAILYSKI